MTEIWEKKLKIKADRRVMMNKLMQEYDETIYYPAIKALQEECEKQGHVRGKMYNNSLGRTWYDCENCGCEMKEEHH